MSAVDSEPFPRGALIAVAALVGLSVVATAAVRIGRIITPPPAASLPAAPIASMDLAFADEADGSVAVRDTRMNRRVASLLPGTNAFIRGVLRSLVRERVAHHIGQAAPFRLSELGDGQLYLQDMATGRIIDLQAFGMGNRASFRHLLHPEEPVAPDRGPFS